VSGGNYARECLLRQTWSYTVNPPRFAIPFVVISTCCK